MPANKPDYAHYHDTEWGRPVHDDQKLFEMLILEGAQAGLSWYTILQRREGYRKAFKSFDPKKVARMTDEQLEALLKDEAIIRNRLKVFSTRKNAQVFLAIQKEFGSFDAYLWRFVGGKPKINRPKSMKDVPASTPDSDALAKDSQKAGHELCRLFDHVRLHAGRRPRQRPHGGLLQSGSVNPASATLIHR